MMGTGDIGCYTADGQEVWKFNLQDRYGKFDIAFGMTSTPVLDGDRLYLQLLHSGGATGLGARQDDRRTRSGNKLVLATPAPSASIRTLRRFCIATASWSYC